MATNVIWHNIVSKSRTWTSPARHVCVQMQPSFPPPTALYINLALGMSLNINTSSIDAIKMADQPVQPVWHIWPPGHSLSEPQRLIHKGCMYILANVLDGFCSTQGRLLI